MIKINFRLGKKGLWEYTEGRKKVTNPDSVSEMMLYFAQRQKRGLKVMI